MIEQRGTELQVKEYYKHLVSLLIRCRTAESYGLENKTLSLSLKNKKQENPGGYRDSSVEGH